MEIAFAPMGARPFRNPDLSHALTAGELATHALAIAGDITLVLRNDGQILDVALGTDAIDANWIEQLLDRLFADTVTLESQIKVSRLLEQAQGATDARWRQVNHHSPLGELPVRYLALPVLSNGHIIVIGRDMGSEAALQQRLIQAQQSIERDYIQMRQAEARYRMLFDLSTEAVIVAETATRRISDANPAACRLVGMSAKELAGRPLTSLFDGMAHEAVVAMMGSVAAAENGDSIAVDLAGGRGAVRLGASLFRQDRSSCFLVRLVPTGQSQRREGPPDMPLSKVLNNIPDALVVTDDALTILAENEAFLDMAQIPRKEQSRGQSLARFLGRPGIDLPLLVSQLRDHGSVRNFSTIVRGLHDSQDEVEVAGVSVTEDGALRFGFSIRSVGRRLPTLTPALPGLPQSVEQLTELVGRISLKEIVRESTDLIERLCIEAALNHTSDNRASAAEVLGLSRQSLYSKLHRHGLGNLGDAPDDA